jgi:hypothetical protein
VKARFNDGCVGIAVGDRLRACGSHRLFHRIYNPGEKAAETSVVAPHSSGRRLLLPHNNEISDIDDTCTFVAS